jgi:hypothetical protein
MTATKKQKQNPETVTMHMHLRAERAVPALALEPGDHLHLTTAPTPDGRLMMALNDGEPVDMEVDDMEAVKKALLDHALDELGERPTIDEVRTAIKTRVAFVRAAIKAEIAEIQASTDRVAPPGC